MASAVAVAAAPATVMVAEQTPQDWTEPDSGWNRREHFLSYQKISCLVLSLSLVNGAGNGVRTRDIKLGKLALYQLSYARTSSNVTTNICRNQT